MVSEFDGFWSNLLVKFSARLAEKLLLYMPPISIEAAEAAHTDSN